MILGNLTVGTDYVDWQKANPDTLGRDTVFLAGPIERVAAGQAKQLPRWRDEALLQLNASGRRMIIFNPEWPERPYGWTYEKQVMWELKHLQRAHIIMFWIPRRLPDLPAFTTNIEFGEWLHSDKIIIGSPPDAPNMNYLRLRCEMRNIPWHNTLESCCAAVADSCDRLHALIQQVESGEVK